MLAKELSPDSTLVREVMTADPESVSPDMSLLDALHLMHDKKYQHLPVVEGGLVLGLVDVMDVMAATMGEEGSGRDGWRTLWDQALDLDEASESASVKSESLKHVNVPKIFVPTVVSRPVQFVPIPARVVIKAPIICRVMEDSSDAASQDLNGHERGHSPQSFGHPSVFDAPFTFKVQDGEGNLHKLSASAEHLEQLIGLVCERLNSTPGLLKLKCKDDDGDEVLITDDASLSEAVDSARSRGDNFVRLRAEISIGSRTPLAISSGVTPKRIDAALLTQPVVAASTGSANSNNMLLIGGVTAVACAALIGFVLMKKKA